MAFVHCKHEVIAHVPEVPNRSPFFRSLLFCSFSARGGFDSWLQKTPGGKTVKGTSFCLPWFVVHFFLTKRTPAGRVHTTTRPHSLSYMSFLLLGDILHVCLLWFSG